MPNLFTKDGALALGGLLKIVQILVLFLKGG